MSATGAKIRIIAVPPGGAPEWIREAWVGLELPLAEQVLGAHFGVCGTHPQNVGGFQIELKKAIEVLKEVSPEAARWWEENAPPGFIDGGRLSFKKEVCEFISA